jgi:hypothetical protein
MLDQGSIHYPVGKLVCMRLINNREVETFVRKTKSNEWLFRKKTLFLCILLTYTLNTQYIYNRSYG